MTFYQLLQLDPFILKQKIHQADTKKQRRYFWRALLIRDILLVSFAILWVSTITFFFGKAVAPFSFIYPLTVGLYVESGNGIAPAKNCD